MTSNPKTLPTLDRRGDALANPERQLQRLDSVDLAGTFASLRGASVGEEFETALAGSGLGTLRTAEIETLQLNLGRVCNQTCAHCHVDAGPDRRESMDRATAELCMEVLASTSIGTVDITGGAPEMCPQFEYLVEESTRLGRRVMDRCNLTILGVSKYRHLPRFLADHRVEVVCSLPHYRKTSTDRQRGDGVFERSIEAIRELNELGYGRPDSGLELTLVTNPVGAFLPGGQASLEGEWKAALRENHGVEFNRLIAIANMPISRYLEWLDDSGNLERYLRRLVEAFNPATVSGLMCRSTLSVDWRGRLYDCDFNQMLGLGVGGGAPEHIGDFSSEALENREVVTRRHCFGCTAGVGSSCGGALAGKS